MAEKRVLYKNKSQSALSLHMHLDRTAPSISFYCFGVSNMGNKFKKGSVIKKQGGGYSQGDGRQRRIRLKSTAEATTLTGPTMEWIIKLKDVKRNRTYGSGPSAASR